MLIDTIKWKKTIFQSLWISPGDIRGCLHHKAETWNTFQCNLRNTCFDDLFIYLFFLVQESIYVSTGFEPWIFMQATHPITTEAGLSGSNTCFEKHTHTRLPMLLLYAIQMVGCLKLIFCCSGTPQVKGFKCTGGIMATEAISLLQRFYEQGNPNGKLFPHSLKLLFLVLWSVKTFLRQQKISVKSC